jgi:hypothetical protein
MEQARKENSATRHSNNFFSHKITLF